MLFVYPYPKDAKEVTSKIEINKIHKFLPDYKGCVADEITAYTDALHKTKMATTSATNLAKNPTLINEETGLISPTIEIKISY
jgi:hypothetical protein